MKHIFLSIALLITANAYGQTITFKPTSQIQTGFTAKGHTFKTGYLDFGSGPNGLYAQSSLLAPKSFILEMTVFWSAAVSDGLLAVKGKSFALTIRNGKLLHQWTSCAGDQYNLSELETSGETVLKPNTKHTIRYEYDANTGQVLIKLNGLVEIQFYRIWPPSEINWTTDVIQLLTGQKGVRLYSAVLSSNKPTLPISFTLRTIVSNGIVHIERPDLTALNTLTRITIEDSYGKTVGVQDFLLTGPTKRAFSLPQSNGIHTVTISNAKGFRRTVCVPVGPSIVWPVPAKGFYNVRTQDFLSIRGIGANLSCSDWVQQREPDGSASVTRYLVEAGKAGLKLSAVGNYTNARTRAFNEPTTNIHSFLVGDEVSGCFERYVASYNSIRVWSSVPVAMSLNNFTRIQEAAECADFMFLNIYNASLEKIIDIVRIASVYRPVIVVLASYQSEPSDGPTIDAQIQTAMDAGAMGTVVFEYDHREKVGEAGWYLPESNTDVLETLKRVWR